MGKVKTGAYNPIPVVPIALVGECYRFPKGPINLGTGGKTMTNRALSRSAAVLTALLVCALIAGDSPSAENSGKLGYQEGNPFEDLVITRVDAEYHLNVHDPEKPKKCGSSRLDLTFEVKNTGSETLKTKRIKLYWRTNKADENWPEQRTKSKKPSKRSEWPDGWWGECRLPEEMGPGQTVTLTAHPDLHHVGKWHPMELEARLGLYDTIIRPHGLKYVGVRDPVNRDFDFGLPDVRVPEGFIEVGKGKIEGREEEFVYARARLEAVGGTYKGPIKFTLTMRPDPEKVEQPEYRRYKHRSIKFAYDLEDGLTGSKTIQMKPMVFSADVLQKQGDIYIRLGCPEHGLRGVATDADPSNNVQTRTPGGEKPKP